MLTDSETTDPEKAVFSEHGVKQGQIQVSTRSRITGKKFLILQWKGSNILSLWSHIKSLLKWFFKAASIWRKHTPFGRSESFEWGNSKRLPRGYSPFSQHITLGAAHLWEAGDALNAKELPVLQRHMVQWQEGTDLNKVLWTPKKKAWPPGWPRRLLCLLATP